ncbi:MAG: hypothetical protein AB7V04_14415 [Desulfomonilaceae bacterium]|nr:hypothetical protein [Syntrophaceae bacterium]
MEGIEVFPTFVPNDSRFAVGGENNRAVIVIEGDLEAAAMVAGFLFFRV